MKWLLLLCFVALLQSASAQSLDYLSLRKTNGRVVKNFYTGSLLTAQLTTGGYLQGPIQAVRNDSVFVTLYDIRRYATQWGSIVKDTISTIIVGVHYKDIQRVAVRQRRGFFSRMAPPLLMIGGAGYTALNLINNAIDKQPITDSKNLRRLGTAVGAFGVGLLLHKLFSSDGFSKKNQHLAYVDL